MTDLFIPTKIKVGFQERKGTYTGKLAYVIYFDEKGKLRKQTSWEGWCDSKIPSIELENTPHNNFVLNKGIQRDGHWGSGRSVIRVYDPRDFEFEISVDNLIGILMHSDVSKRDIVQECVYAWAGKELVLLPTNSDEYQKSIVYTDKQSKNISTKDLVKGHVYSQKKSKENLTYIGYYQCYEFKSYPTRGQKDKGKKHIFYDGNHFVTPGIQTLAEEVVSEPVANYAKLVDKWWNESFMSRKLVDIKILPKIKSGKYYKKKSDNEFTTVNCHFWNNTPSSLTNSVYESNSRYYLDKNNVINIETTNGRNYFGYYQHSYTTCEAEIKKYFNENKIDEKSFTKQEFDDTMKALGYGLAVFVNEDGKELPYYD